MSYTADKDGYALEATKGTSVITGAGDTTYLLGMMATKNIWPSPEFSTRTMGVGVGAVEPDAGNIWKDHAECRGMLTFMVQNGVPIFLAMGASATAGGGPYTHTITPVQTLPSITIQHEESGSGTAEQYQFPGVMVDSLVLSHDAAGPDFLMAKMEIMSFKPTDPGFALTTDPALPATANAAPYQALTRTWDYGAGNLALDGLQKVEITIANGLTPLYGTMWDTGTYIGEWPYNIIEHRMKQYQIDLSFHPDTVERAMWDELMTIANTKELYFKWTRSANDYIAVTATDCQVMKHTITTDPNGLKLVEATVKPRALSFSVVDSIAGGAYAD